MKLEKIEDQFLDFIDSSGYPESTIKGYRADVLQFINLLIEQNIEKIQDVSLETINNYLDYLNQQGYALRSISRKINAIKLLFRYLEDSGRVPDNFVKDIHHPKFEDKEPRILSDEELIRLREVIENDLRNQAITETLLQTGMKIGELANLKLENIRLNPGPKFGEVVVEERTGSRKIPINNAMEAVMEKYLEQRPFSLSQRVFVTKNGRPIPERNIRRKIQEYFAKAGMSNVMVNDLRNTFIAHQLMKGLTIGRVSYLAGYKNLSSMNKFIQVLEGRYDIEQETGIEEV